MYFHPFNDPDHNIGFGPQSTRVLSSSASLHGIAPTLSKRTLQGKSRAHFKYYYKLPADGSDTFAKYKNADHLIYVLGHCVPGSGSLFSGGGKRNGRSECTARQLSNRLADHGLPAGSQAQIRIHACDSDSATDTESSFASKFWEFISQDYPGVTVRGYDQKMGPYCVTRFGEDFWTSANAHHFDYYSGAENWLGDHKGRVV